LISPAEKMLSIHSAGETNFCENLDTVHIRWLVVEGEPDGPLKLFVSSQIWVGHGAISDLDFLGLNYLFLYQNYFTREPCEIKLILGWD